jgi:hypothetical protein
MHHLYGYRPPIPDLIDTFGKVKEFVVANYPYCKGSFLCFGAKLLFMVARKLLKYKCNFKEKNSTMENHRVPHF